MKNYIFRGKSVKTGKWIESSTFLIKGEESSILPPFAELYDGKMWIEVYYNTLGQWSGKFDITGKKIFDGDIVSRYFKEDTDDDVTPENADSEERFIVCFDEKINEWKVKSIERPNNLWGFSDIDLHKGYITGNVYDNIENSNGRADKE